MPGSNKAACWCGLPVRASPQSDDDLVPVKLRRGGRSLGGSLTWEKPQHLAAFAADGPFTALAVPKDVTVNRQVLAEPDAALATRTWASLEDGTPLVTGEHRGKGVVSLFHVSADTRWSNLPMSGSFVEMLQANRRCVRLHLQAGRRRRRRNQCAKRWRRCAPSMASARSDRRRRRPSRCPPTSAIAPRWIIRRASTARPTVRSPSTRWRRPTASRRSIPLRCARGTPATPMPNRAISGEFCWRQRWRCS